MYRVPLNAVSAWVKNKVIKDFRRYLFEQKVKVQRKQF